MLGFATSKRMYMSKLFYRKLLLPAVSKYRGPINWIAFRIFPRFLVSFSLSFAKYAAATVSALAFALTYTDKDARLNTKNLSSLAPNGPARTPKLTHTSGQR